MRERAKALLLLAVLVCGCGCGYAEEGPHRARLEHKLSVDVQYPVTGQSKVDRIIQDWLEEKVKKDMESLSGVGLDPERDESSDTISVSYTVSRPSERAVSYVFETYVYPWRAAHPMSYASVLNVDLDQRERLETKDIFANPDRALKLLAEKSPAAVKADLSERMSEEFPDGVGEDVLFMDGFKPEWSNYETLILEPNGIRVVFQLYQVLPYVFGKPEAFIPLDELEEAGPNKALWNRQ